MKKLGVFSLHDIFFFPLGKDDALMLLLAPKGRSAIQVSVQHFGAAERTFHSNISFKYWYYPLYNTIYSVKLQEKISIFIKRSHKEEGDIIFISRVMIIPRSITSPDS